MFYWTLAAIGWLLTTQTLILKFLVNLFVSHIHVTDTKLIDNIDTFLVTRARSVIYNNFRILPDDGIHCLFYAKMILIRTSTPPTDYSPSVTYYDIWHTCSQSFVIELFDSNANHKCVRCIFYERLSPYQYSTLTSCVALLPVIRPWQQEVVNVILKFYQAHRRAIVLIRGPSNSGKTSLGRCVAQELMRDDNNNVRPIIVNGFNYAIPGSSLIQLLPSHLNVSFPYIVMMNEFDKCLPKKPSNDMGQVRSVCDTIDSFHNELDRLQTIDNIIIIATSEWPVRRLFKRFKSTVGPHRFHAVIDITGVK